jgi:SAM-dependent methyltransferase
MTVLTRTWALPVAGPGGDPQLGCDLPLDLGPIVIHNELFVGGWAVAGAGRIIAVEVELGGRTVLASYGHPSPFLRDAFPDAAFARYEVKLDTSELARGEHTIRLRATTSEGASAEMEGVVEAEPYRLAAWQPERQRQILESGGAAMWCDAPDIYNEAEVSAPVSVRGWAFAPSGIDKVVVFVDGHRHETHTGVRRTELRFSHGPEVAEDAGFRVLIRDPEIAPGRHEVTVIAYPRDQDPIGVSGSLQVVDQQIVWSPGPVEVPEEVGDERYVEDRDHGTSIEIEHHARYRWAATLVAGKRVLDAGCGTAWGTALLARAGARVTGVDLNPHALEYGRLEYGAHLDLHVGDLCALQFDDCSFDIVVCFEAIEHLDDPSSALDHFRRVLRPDGQLIISTPVKGVYPAGNPFHVNEFAAGELEAALRRRFDHVVAYRQRTYAASILSDDAVSAHDDADVSLDLDVRKLEGVAPGEELYTVAVASDAELPGAPRIAVAGQALDHRALEDELLKARSDNDEAVGELKYARMHLLLAIESRDATITVNQELQAELRRTREALETELERCREALAAADARLQAVVDSRSWRWAAPLRATAQRARDAKVQRTKP